MRKTLLSILFCISIAFQIQAQESNISDCYQNFESQKKLGYNVLAMAIDNGFFVCGYAFGVGDKGYAARIANNECERKRLSPENEIQGIRKIMTHCRIYEFKLIE